MRLSLQHALLLFYLCLSPFMHPAHSLAKPSIPYDGTLEEVRAAIKAGGDVNEIVDKDEQTTILMRAAEKNTNPDVITTLIAAGADVNIKDKDGKTALSLAQEKNNTEVIKRLKEAGAK